MKDNEDEIRESHPSWGMVSFSRVNHTPHRFFGSDISHLNSISLRISTGYTVRSNYHDHFMSGDPLIEVHMTEMQFAKLLTTMNYASGAPCTIAYCRDGDLKQIPFSPESSQRERFNQDIKRETKKLTEELLSSLRTIITEASMGKGIKTLLLKSLDTLQMGLVQNLPYLLDSYKESMDKVETDAKASVEGYIAAAVRETRVKTLNQLSEVFQNATVSKVEVVEAPKKLLTVRSKELKKK